VSQLMKFMITWAKHGNWQPQALLQPGTLGSPSDPGKTQMNFSTLVANFECPSQHIQPQFQRHSAFAGPPYLPHTQVLRSFERNFLHKLKMATQKNKARNKTKNTASWMTSTDLKTHISFLHSCNLSGACKLHNFTEMHRNGGARFMFPGPCCKYIVLINLLCNIL